MEDFNLLKEFELKNNLGHNLIQQLDELNNFDGKFKLNKKIEREIHFLKEVYEKKTLKKEHLVCSNLIFYEAFVNCLLNINNIKAVLHKVNVEPDRKISIDIITDEGSTWIKIIARNTKSLTLQLQGDCGFGQRNIIDHARDFKQAAKINSYLFSEPKILFYFSTNLDAELTRDLENIGIIVNSKFSQCELNSKTPLSQQFINITKLNLDITCLIAYVSSLSNENVSNYTFSDPILREQAEWEKKDPIKPYLEKYFNGKILCACKTAIENFKNIMSILAGPKELDRSNELLNRIQIVDDQMSCRVSNLKLKGKINNRSKIIFGTGDYHQWPTITANKGFIRSANQQGVELCVFLHDARALTEEKEIPIDHTI